MPTAKSANVRLIWTPASPHHASTSTSTSPSPAQPLLLPQPHSPSTQRPLLAALLSVSARVSPLVSRPLSPLDSAPPSIAPATSPKVQLHNLEASYIAKVSSKLKELVNKVFPCANENGLVFMRCTAPRPAAAFELGEALKHEMNVCSSDSYISRALLRTAIIPALTIYLNRLEPLLVPISDHPTVLFVPKTLKQVENALPLVLRYTIEVIKSAWVVGRALEDLCASSSCSSEWHGETAKFLPAKVLQHGLLPFTQKLDALIQRFMAPYLMEIKATVMSHISPLRLTTGHEILLHNPTHPPHPPKHVLHRTTAPSPGTLSNVWLSSITTTAHHHDSPSETLSELAKLLEAVRSLLMYKLACGAKSRTWMVSIGSQAVWKAMLAFSARRRPSQSPPHSSLAPTPTTIKATTTTGQLRPSLMRQQDSSLVGGLKGARHILRSAAGSGTPATNATANKRVMMPSVGSEEAFYTKLQIDVKAFSSMICLFVKDIAEPGRADVAVTQRRQCELEGNDGCAICRYGLAITSGNNVGRGVDRDIRDGEAEEDLVRDAMNEALQAFEAFEVVLLGLLEPEKVLLCIKTSSTVTHNSNTSLSSTPQEAKKGERKIAQAEICPTLKSALDEIPLVILLHLVASRITIIMRQTMGDDCGGPVPVEFRLPNVVWGLEWDQYEDILKGFGVAELWCDKIGIEMLKELKSLKKKSCRVLEEEGVIVNQNVSTQDKLISDGDHWMKIGDRHHNDDRNGNGHHGHHNGDDKEATSLGGIYGEMLDIICRSKLGIYLC